MENQKKPNILHNLKSLGAMFSNSKNISKHPFYKLSHNSCLTGITEGSKVMVFGFLNVFHPFDKKMK